MFNQKVNGYWSQNPDYLNYSLGAPGINPVDIHNCGTTIQKYMKSERCGSLPLQTWCSPNVAVESFGMRPIVNPKDYFQNIQKFLGSIIYTDSIPLKASGMSSENYSILTDYGIEPQSSFLQAINLEVTDHIMTIMCQATNEIPMYNTVNPITEGLIMNDVEIETYQSTINENHFFHKVLFAVVNTTRYNTISMSATVYQDTTNMMSQWISNINQVMKSENVSNSTSGSVVYIANINFLNNTNCVLGEESDCQMSGFNFGGKWSQLLNEKLLASPTGINWLQPNAMANNTYNSAGNYDTNGQIRIVDNGPPDINNLLNQFKK